MHVLWLNGMSYWKAVSTRAWNGTVWKGQGGSALQRRESKKGRESYFTGTYFSLVSTSKWAAGPLTSDTNHQPFNPVPFSSIGGTDCTRYICILTVFEQNFRLYIGGPDFCLCHRSHKLYLSSMRRCLPGCIECVRMGWVWFYTGNSATFCWRWSSDWW